jgi:hypothetical protein
MTSRSRCRFVSRVWGLFRVSRFPGGGESRDILKLGPLCIKRWSPRVSPAEIRLRCRISREISVCNRMWYVPWFHWTIARCRSGIPAAHRICNAILDGFPALADLHPGNVLITLQKPVVIDFKINPTLMAGRRLD